MEADFHARLSVESQPQIPEFRNNPENFHPWQLRFRLSTGSYLLTYTPGDEEFNLLKSTEANKRFVGSFHFLTHLSHELL